MRQYRNESHPDSFQDENHKKEAEERFKVAQAILDEFWQHFERDRLKRAPHEMTLYKPLYNLVQIQQENDSLKNELSKVKAEFASERQTNASLSKQVQEKEDDSLKTEIQYPRPGAGWGRPRHHGRRCWAGDAGVDGGTVSNHAAEHHPSFESDLRGW